MAGNFRHIIFNLSLQEGWDDPECCFAYIDKQIGSPDQVTLGFEPRPFEQPSRSSRTSRCPGSYAERCRTAARNIRILPDGETPPRGYTTARGKRTANGSGFDGVVRQSVLARRGRHGQSPLLARRAAQKPADAVPLPASWSQ